MADSPRWCETCNAYGDHHTDRHEHMVNDAPLPEVFRINGVEHSVQDGVLMRRVAGEWMAIRKSDRGRFW